jgi:DNA mismatch endonuclease (patch repair protein)
MDIVSEEQRSYNMSRIRSKDTKPERVVRSLLHAFGFRFTVYGPKNRNLPENAAPASTDRVGE